VVVRQPPKAQNPFFFFFFFLPFGGGQTTTLAMGAGSTISIPAMGVAPSTPDYLLFFFFFLKIFSFFFFFFFFIIKINNFNGQNDVVLGLVGVVFLSPKRCNFEVRI
jgi:hypothetical protein